MIRRVIQIDVEKCNGCGACANACHEGAIGIVNGKAKLMRDDYCDGLGDCLPNCPTNAISFIERDAVPYDEKAVLANKEAKTAHLSVSYKPNDFEEIKGCLSQWPVQMKLTPLTATYFDNCDLLIAADCTAFAYGDFHRRFIKDRVTLIGCPKLDSVNYAEKLADIFKQNAIRSITVTRMQVPCCGGLPYAVQNALRDCEKTIPLTTVMISPSGEILRIEKT